MSTWTPASKTSTTWQGAASGSAGAALGLLLAITGGGRNIWGGTQKPTTTWQSVGIGTSGTPTGMLLAITTA